MVVLCYHKHGKGDSVHMFGTPGAGEAFVGLTREGMSSKGKAVMNLFKRFCHIVIQYVHVAFIHYYVQMLFASVLRMYEHTQLV